MSLKDNQVNTLSRSFRDTLFFNVNVYKLFIGCNAVSQTSVKPWCHTTTVSRYLAHGVTWALIGSSDFS